MSVMLNDRSITVRRIRAGLKHRIRTAGGRHRAAQVTAGIVEDFPPEAARMHVGTLLHACRQERVHVWQLLANSGIWFESKELGELTERQKSALVALLRKAS